MIIEIESVRHDIALVWFVLELRVEVRTQENDMLLEGCANITSTMGAHYANERRDHSINIGSCAHVSAEIPLEKIPVAKRTRRRTEHCLAHSRWFYSLAHLCQEFV